MQTKLWRRRSRTFTQIDKQHDAPTDQRWLNQMAMCSVVARENIADVISQLVEVGGAILQWLRV